MQKKNHNAEREKKGTNYELVSLSSTMRLLAAVYRQDNVYPLSYGLRAASDFYYYVISPRPTGTLRSIS